MPSYWPISSSGGGITTQTDQTASRVLGTIYRNTTNKTMNVAVTTSSTGVAALAGFTDGTVSATLLVQANRMASVGSYYSIFFTVIPNNYYRVTVDTGTPTLVNWTEWT